MNFKFEEDFIAFLTKNLVMLVGVTENSGSG